MTPRPRRRRCRWIRSRSTTTRRACRSTSRRSVGGHGRGRQVADFGNRRRHGSDQLAIKAPTPQAPPTGMFSNARQEGVGSSSRPPTGAPPAPTRAILFEGNATAESGTRSPCRAAPRSGRRTLRGARLQQRPDRRGASALNPTSRWSTSTFLTTTKTGNDLGIAPARLPPGGGSRQLRSSTPTSRATASPQARPSPSRCSAAARTRSSSAGSARAAWTSPSPASPARPTHLLRGAPGPCSRSRCQGPGGGAGADIRLVCHEALPRVRQCAQVRQHWDWKNQAAPDELLHELLDRETCSTTPSLRASPSRGRRTACPRSSARRSCGTSATTTTSRTTPASVGASRVRAARALCLCALGACRAGVPALEQPPQVDAGTPPERKTTMSQDEAGAPDPIPSPKVLLEAAPRYLIGFPLVVAVTYDNRSGPTEFFLLPSLDLRLDALLGHRPNLAPAGRRRAGVEPHAGHLDPPTSWRWNRTASLRSAKLGGTRKSERMLLDLSSFGVAAPARGDGEGHFPKLGPALLQPGKYRLTVTLRGAGSKEATASNPVTVEIVAPEPADACGGDAAAHASAPGHGLRQRGMVARFLASNGNAVVPSATLSFEAQRQLALHLFLHRAYLRARARRPGSTRRPARPRHRAQPGRRRRPRSGTRSTRRAGPRTRRQMHRRPARRSWPGMRWRLAARPGSPEGNPTPLPLARGRRASTGRTGPTRPAPAGRAPYTK